MSAATQNTPEHGTKRTVAQLVSYRPDMRVIGIDRKGLAVVIPLMIADEKLVLECDANWKAWTVRLPKGRYQQISVFEPQAEEA
jgi:hypothetical protein